MPFAFLPLFNCFSLVGEFGKFCVFCLYLFCDQVRYFFFNSVNCRFVLIILALPSREVNFSFLISCGCSWETTLTSESLRLNP